MKPAKTFKNMREKAEHQGLIFTMPKIKKSEKNQRENRAKTSGTNTTKTNAKIQQN